MACYDRVSCSVDPNTGALTVYTKSGSCTVTPGDTVTFTETAVGYIITINGEPNIIPKPDEDQYGDDVTFTETDDEYIITINNEPNVIPKCDRTFVNCAGDFIVPCRDRIVTCEELQEVIDTIPEDRPQTRVAPVSESETGTHTYNVNHFGTWPNEVIRTPFLERQGGIAIINIYNPDAGEWQKVAYEAPDDLVILNNPVIYVDSENGSANPPINQQSDLVGNPFNSFNAVRNFMNRTLSVGRVTIVVNGLVTDGGQVGPSTFKNANDILIRGEPGGAAAARIRWGMDGVAGVSSGLATTGGTVTMRDITLEGINSQNPTDYTACAIIGSGSELVLQGEIRITGNYDTTSKPSAFFFRNTAGGVLTLSSNLTLTFAMTAGSVVTAPFLVAPPSRMNVGGNVTFNFTTSRITSQNALFNLSSGGILSFNNTAAAPNPLAVTGAQRMIAPASVEVTPLSVVSGSGAYGNRAALIAYDFGPQVSAGGATATMDVDAIGVVSNVAGP